MVAVCDSQYLWAKWLPYPEMVTLVPFCSSGSLNSNLFCHLFGFEKTWKLQTLFTTAVNLLPGVNFWLSPLLIFGGLYFHLQVIIHKSKFQQGLAFCKFWFLQKLSLGSMFLTMMAKACLYSQGHCVSVCDRMVMSCKVFYFTSGSNLHNLSIRAQCEAPLIKYLSCQPGRERGCACWQQMTPSYWWNCGNLSHYFCIWSHKCKTIQAGKDIRRSLFHPSAQRRVNIWGQIGLQRTFSSQGLKLQGQTPPSLCISSATALIGKLFFF